MNPNSSESITADVFMEFEDDASAFAGAEPEFVYTPGATVPLSIAAAPGLEQLKALLAALSPQERGDGGVSHPIAWRNGESGVGAPGPRKDSGFPRTGSTRRPRGTLTQHEPLGL